MLKSGLMSATRCVPAFFILFFSMAVFAADTVPAEPEVVAVRFEIKSFAVEGSNLLSAEEVNAAVLPFVGKDKDFSDVQHALEAVEELYVKKGYTAVQVLLPEQELQNGRVRFRAVESRYGQIIVKGQKYFSTQSAYDALPSLRKGEVPRSKQVSSELRLANENPARQMNVVLKAGKTDDQVDADVQVTDQDPTTWTATFDNSGSAETGFTRLGLSYRNANVLDEGHILALQMQVSPQHTDRVRVFGAGYKIPLYKYGDSVDFFGGYSNVNSLVGGLSNFQGGGVLLNAHYNHSLDKIAGFDPRLTFGIDWRDFKRIEQTTPGPAILYNEIVVTPLSIVFAAQGKSERSNTDFDIGFAANVPMSGSGDKAAFANYDPAGTLMPDQKYRIVSYDASHIHTIGDDWQGRVAITGQWTRNILILGEQLRLGGANGVRGFSEGSEAGESGTRGTLEGYTPNITLGGANGRGLVFFDAGEVRSKSGLKSNITSAGVGLRSTWNVVSFRMDVGRIGKAGTDPLQHVGDWRIHASLAATF